MGGGERGKLNGVMLGRENQSSGIIKEREDGSKCQYMREHMLRETKEQKHVFGKRFCLGISTNMPCVPCSTPKDLLKKPKKLFHMFLQKVVSLSFLK